MITEAYKEQNRQLHAQDEAFGISGAKWFDSVEQICRLHKTRNVLDYGCGKGTLVERLRRNGYDAHGFDPAVEMFSERPRPADVVTCTDVMEHIEPEYLETVLEDLKGLTRKACMMVVSTRPAHKNLPDGRNAHLIVEQPEWWLPRIMVHFRLAQFQAAEAGFICLLEPK